MRKQPRITARWRRTTEDVPPPGPSHSQIVPKTQDALIHHPGARLLSSNRHALITLSWQIYRLSYNLRWDIRKQMLSAVRSTRCELSPRKEFICQFVRLACLTPLFGSVSSRSDERRTIGCNDVLEVRIPPCDGRRGSCLEVAAGSRLPNTLTGWVGGLRCSTHRRVRHSLHIRRDDDSCPNPATPSTSARPC